MKHWKVLIALLLAVFMMVGCSNPGNETTTTQAGITQQGASDTTPQGTEDPAAKDVYVSAQVKDEDVVIKVGEERLDIGNFKFYRDLQVHIAKQTYGPNVMEQKLNGVPLLQIITDNVARDLTNTFVMITEAKAQGIVVTKGEVEAEFKEFMSQLDDERKKLFFETMGATEANIRDEIARSLYLSKYTTKIREELEKSKELEDFFKNEVVEVKARHILVDTEEKAKELLEKIEGGESFSDLAAAHSNDAANKDQGGDLGYFQYERMVQPFADKAFSLKPGEMGIAQTTFGFHVILVEDNRTVEKMEADEAVSDTDVQAAKDTLTKRLLNTKLGKLIEEASQKYPAETHLDKVPVEQKDEQK